MSSLPFVTLDVFTQDRFRGNPLAVVELPAGTKDESPLPTGLLQTIASEFNLSETVFLHEKVDKDESGVPQWRVRIFTTESELPFAGHPTIGTAVYALGTLAGVEKGRFICNAGPIDLELAGGVAQASIPHNVHVHTENQVTSDNVSKLQPALQGKTASISNIAVVSPVKGMNFICVELEKLEDLASVETSSSKPRAKLDAEWDTGFTGSYFYVITKSTSREHGGKASVSVQTRMIEGALEDPATGSAACGLSAYLAMRLKLAREVSFNIVQGMEMGRRSDIGVDIALKQSMDAVEKVVLKGAAIKVMEGKVDYDA
ncbi:hypothetical protein MBLNU230_g8111t1 [Neophaeotheca triangularis]